MSYLKKEYVDYTEHLGRCSEKSHIKGRSWTFEEVFVTLPLTGLWENSTNLSVSTFSTWYIVMFCLSLYCQEEYGMVVWNLSSAFLYYK